MLKSNTHIYYVRFANSRMMIAFFSIVFFLSANSLAQQKDTAKVDLTEVLVTSVRAEKFTAGKKIQKIDSTSLAHFGNTNLGDLLAINTPVFVKNYGPGSLSTTSFRG